MQNKMGKIKMVSYLNKQQSSKLRRTTDDSTYNLLLVCEGGDEESFLKIHLEAIRNSINNNFKDQYSDVEIKVISKDSKTKSFVTTGFLNTLQSCVAKLDDATSDYVAYNKICFIYDTDIFKKEFNRQNKPKIQENYQTADVKITSFNKRNRHNKLPVLVRCISNPCLEIIFLINRDCSCVKAHTSPKGVIADYNKTATLKYNKDCAKSKEKVWRSLDIQKILVNLKKHYQSHELDCVWLTTADNYSELFKIIE